MLELYELRQFITFADAGTLSEAAEILHLSQPALSRNMKKLEEDFGITLFERKKNKLILNKNGTYVLELARQLVADADSLIEKVHQFDRQNRTILLGSCAPAPLWTLTPFIAGLYSKMTLQTEIAAEDDLKKQLKDHTYQLITLHEKPEDNSLYYQICGREHLMFSIPTSHPYASRDSLTFAEMNGENMLLMPDIGFWSFVTQKMPDSRFLTQSDRFSFQELVQASSLPCFVTDLSEKNRVHQPNRIYIPISDPEATVTYYLTCLKEQKKEWKELFELLQ